MPADDIEQMAHVIAQACQEDQNHPPPAGLDLDKVHEAIAAAGRHADEDDYPAAYGSASACARLLLAEVESLQTQVARYGAIAETARALCLKASPGRELHIDGPTLRTEFRALVAAANTAEALAMAAVGALPVRTEATDARD